MEISQSHLHKIQNIQSLVLSLKEETREYTRQVLLDKIEELVSNLKNEFEEEFDVDPGMLATWANEAIRKSNERRPVYSDQAIIGTMDISSDVINDMMKKSEKFSSIVDNMIKESEERRTNPKAVDREGMDKILCSDQDTDSLSS